MNIHPSKNVTQHNFNRLYQFIYGFVFIMLRIIWKLGYLSFHWYLICCDCFEGTCAGRLNWVQCPKINVAKLDHNFNRWYQFLYGIIFIMLGIIWKPVYLSLHLYILCNDCLAQTCARWLYFAHCQKTDIPKLHHCLKFSTIFCFGGFWYNEWAVGTCMCTYIRSQNALSIQSDQFCIFSFLTLSPIYSPTHAPVKQA